MVSPAEVSVPVEANPQSEGKNKRLKRIFDYAISYGLDEDHADDFLIYLEKVLLVNPHKWFLSKRILRASVFEFKEHFIGTYRNLGGFGRYFLNMERVLSSIPEEVLPYINFSQWVKRSIVNKDIRVTYLVKGNVGENISIFHDNENHPYTKPKDFSTIDKLVKVKNRREKSRKVDEFFNNYSHDKNGEREDENKSISETYDHPDITGSLIAPFETFTEDFYGILAKNLDEDTLESVFDDFRTSFLGEHESPEYFGIYLLNRAIGGITERFEDIIANTHFEEWETSSTVENGGNYYYIPTPTNDGVYVFSKEG